MAWEVNRTVRVPLDVPNDRKSDLHATNDQFQYGANRTRYAANADYNAAKNIARKHALNLLRGQKSSEGGGVLSVRPEVGGDDRERY